MSKITLVDARDAHKVPFLTEVKTKDLKTVSKWLVRRPFGGTEPIWVVIYDDYYSVLCTDWYTGRYFLCNKWKRYSSAKKWVKRFHEEAKEVK